MPVTVTVHSFAEEHLPKHMRLNFVQRLIRFLFVPLCMAAVVGCLHWDGTYKEILDLCDQRNACFAMCLADNFPQLNCEVVRDTVIEYRGNVYENFFYYPANDSPNYQKCYSYLSDVSLPSDSPNHYVPEPLSPHFEH